MAKENLDRCLAVTLRHEGGWSDHKKDPGGATMMGVTLATYRRYKPGATKSDLRSITMARVQEIYRDGFWSPIAGDALPFGIDLATFDFAVNSGPSRGVKALQAAIGAKVDGKAGADTILKASKADGKKAIQAMCAGRLSFMKSLKIWSTFKNGWSRRVAEIEAKAVSMWLTKGTGAIGGKERAILKDEADKAAGKAKAQERGTGGAIGSGAGAGGADVAAGGDLNWLLIGGIAAAVAIAIVLLVIHSKKNRERARAYSAAAAG
ncbi:hypothetical protein GOA90_25050 [Sinorhizobium meliloti]|nr:hypothetical protein [Sinorhizobium meliloti]